MSKIISRIASVLLSIALAFSVQGNLFIAEAADTQMRELTTAELVKDMGYGINIGNTMEACGDWIA